MNQPKTPISVRNRSEGPRANSGQGLIHCDM